MLDPRIYRMSLLLPALALLVLAFSLSPEPGGRSSSLAPIAFNGSNVTRTMGTLQARYPGRTAGSSADAGVAGAVGRSLGSSSDGFSVRRATFLGHTPHGEATLVNVIATRTGTASNAGSVLVVAPRDGPGLAGLSGTATLLELGRVLGGETLDRTVVLASVNGVQGTRRLAAQLSGPIDAVVVLGDLAAAHPRGPIIVPWSAEERVAPVALRATLSAALESETGRRAGAPDTLSQLGHLAFPLTISAQAPFADRGVPAVELSLSGEHATRVGEPIAGAAQIGALGRAVLSTVSALDNGGALAAPSAYVIFDRQVVPGWAMSLFVLMLLLPVVLTTIDGLARARRRRYPLLTSLRAVLTAAVPFLAAVIVIMLAGVVGALPALPDAPAAGTVAVSEGAIAVLAVAVLAALAGALLARPGFAALRAGDDTAADRGAGLAAAILLVTCVVAILVWLGNPFAAALLVPALHLWLWALDGDLPLPSPVRVVMLLIGALPTAGLVLFYAHGLGFGPAGLVWEAALLLAGHGTSWVGALEWALALGCLASALALVILREGVPESSSPAVSVRGPVGYAGPGSLGGTKSALRR